MFPVASVTVNEGVLVEAKRPLIKKKKKKKLESNSQRGHSIPRAQKFQVPASGDQRHGKVMRGLLFQAWDRFRVGIPNFVCCF